MVKAWDCHSCLESWPCGDSWQTQRSIPLETLFSCVCTISWVLHASFSAGGWEQGLSYHLYLWSLLRKGLAVVWAYILVECLSEMVGCISQHRVDFLSLFIRYNASTLDLALLVLDQCSHRNMMPFMSCHFTETCVGIKAIYEDWKFLLLPSSLLPSSISSFLSFFVVL